VIESVAVGSASVAPKIVPIGTRIFVCVRLHDCVGSIVSEIFVSGIVVCLGAFVGVGIKFIRPKIIGIRLKNGGIINFIVIRDANIIVIRDANVSVVVDFNVIIAVRFLDNIIVGFGRIENIFGNISYSSADSTSSFKTSSTDAFGRHSNSGTPPLISGWPSFSAMASTAEMTALVMGISVY